ncbi:peptidase inhibitor family I36 protein [Streptomyces sp. ISL-36]|uniref:peptidase inhibitor family I36 protein n=1 Tax=Streptomyces sp. ISL-36 TaxID=2819182 RepID=UPI001BEB3D4F|nr:peptidase inhibitor family I36 protein [Streptomyces sp. ISL-36]MBT2439592.1 peptidase inhibitor family I36 protein [Streptomyces sp. ISL-36]
MSRTNGTLRLALCLTVAAVAGTLAAPSTAGAAAPVDPWTCTPGAFCVYSGTDGTGKACGWQVDDPDWLQGSTACGWARNTRVRSAFNNGGSGMPVSAFTRTGFKETKVFCLGKGEKTNLRGAGTYLRSHTWKC